MSMAMRLSREHAQGEGAALGSGGQASTLYTQSSRCRPATAHVGAQALVGLRGSLQSEARPWRLRRGRRASRRGGDHAEGETARPSSSRLSTKSDISGATSSSTASMSRLLGGDDEPMLIVPLAERMAALEQALNKLPEPEPVATA